MLLLPKPMAEDVTEMRDGQVLWGWPHCVQDETITQLAIDRRLTLIAWEAMNHWGDDGSFGIHVFHNNNELAGYCSVLHAMELIGTTGEYGRRAASRGDHLRRDRARRGDGAGALGIQDVSVLTRRPVAAVAAPIHSARMITFARDPRPPRPDARARQRARVRRRVPRRARHHRQLRPPGHRRAADVRHERRAGAVPDRQPVRRRGLRRGNGLRVGAADVVRGSDLHDRRRPLLLRGRSQPFVPVGLGHVGDQPGPDAPPAHRDLRTAGHGRPTRQSAGRSRSATARSRTRRSVRSRAARPPSRTSGSD